MAQGLIYAVKHTVKRYTKFLIIGAMNAFVDVFVLNILLWLAPARTAWALSLYNTVAVIAALLNSYVWNRRWTFGDVATGSTRERVLFFLQAILNLVLNDVIVVWISSYLVFSKSVPFFISSNAAKAIAMMASSSVSYLCMRWFVFRTRDRIQMAAGKHL
jgi:putative flippase GtrA